MQSPYSARSEKQPPSKIADQPHFRKWTFREASRSSSEDVSPHTLVASSTITPTHKRTCTTAGRSTHSSPLSTLSARPLLTQRGPYTKEYEVLDIQSEARPTSAGPLLSTHAFASHQTWNSRHSADSATSDRGSEVSPNRRRQFSSSAPSEDQDIRESGTRRRWKREISSHLVEMGVKGKTRQNDYMTDQSFSGSASAYENESEAHYGLEWSRNADSTLLGTEAIAVSSSSLQKKKQGLPRSPNMKISPGLYCRVRHRLGLKKEPVFVCDSEKNSGAENNETKIMLNQTAELLRDLPEYRSMRSGISTSTSKLSIAAIRDRKGALASAASAASSLRNLFMGKQPSPSPDLTALYTGSDNEQYFRVEMSGMDAPNFLPTEARRIDTPPLAHRGFFFDFHSAAGCREEKSPSWETHNCQNSTMSKTLPRKSSRYFQPEPDKDWFRVQVYRSTARNSFELNVPEHLPSSPLCASNPKHSSGGKGICPYHGRSLADSTQNSEATEEQANINKREGES